MKADVGILEIWDELSRVLPDNTFLTETRIADGKVTVSGFSADAARLVRVIDQSPLFSGATLATAITPDATEHKDRFSITFKVRGGTNRTAGRKRPEFARHDRFDRPENGSHSVCFWRSTSLLCSSLLPLSIAPILAHFTGRSEDISENAAQLAHFQSISATPKP